MLGTLNAAGVRLSTMESRHHPFPAGVGNVETLVCQGCAHDQVGIPGEACERCRSTATVGCGPVQWDVQDGSKESGPFGVVRRRPLHRSQLQDAATLDLSSVRDRRLDLVRGWAVVLMVLDHVLALWLLHGGPAAAGVVRSTLTRLALPAFMLVAGWLWSRRGSSTSGWRWAEVMALGVFSTAAMAALGLPVPEVLVVFAMAAVLGPVLLRWPVATSVLGLLQAVNQPLPWAGYQPGYLLLWLGLGVLAHRAAVVWSVPLWLDRPGFEAIGRRPLMWYGGHLVMLLVLVAVAE